MKRDLISVLTIILCLSLMFAATMTVMATEPEGGAESSSSQNTETEVSSSDEGIGSDESSEENESSSSDESSGDETSSDESSSEESSDESSEDGESSDESSEEETSSEETSSKKPIYSNGAGGGSTFIDENDSQIAEGNSSIVSSEPTTSSGTSSTGEIQPEDEHFEGEATTVKDKIFKVIWIPIVVSVLCIAGLVYVNLFWNKHSKPIHSARTSSQNNDSKSTGAKRRKRKKW